MKQTLLFFSIIIISIAAQAQFLTNPYFNLYNTIPCPADSMVMVTAPQDWTLYQTLDDSWAGPKDSSICISVKKGQFNYCKVALNQIDPSRHLFITSSFNSDDNYTLANSHWIYMITSNLGKTNGSTFSINGSANCNPGPCSYLRVRIEVPDTDYVFNGYSFREHVLSFDSIGDNTYTMKCFPTEKFDQQYIRQAIMGLTFENVGINDSLILYNCYIEQTFFFESLQEIYAYPVGNIFEYHFPYFTPTLLLYTDSTYPSLSNISYLNVFPQNAIDTMQEQIDVYIDEYSEVVIECFVQLRGAEVTNHPGIYHNINLIDNGGGICMNTGGDQPFKDGDEFTYRAGKIEFGGVLSCLVFLNGSSLIIPDGVTFNYGTENNFGVLSVRDKTNILIGKNAALNIYNKMFVFEEKPEQGAKQFFMDLNTGSALRFMPGSHLTNLYSVDNSILLNVNMNGGILDDSGLPEDERWMINRIYKADDIVPSSLTIFPNPCESNTIVQINSPDNENATLNIYDAAGIMVQQINLSLQKGVNEINVPVENISSGIYVMRVLYEDDKTTIENRLVKK